MWNKCAIVTVLLSLMCTIVHGSKNIFHGSIFRLEKIVQVEKGVAKAVEEYVSSMERRLVLAKRYLQDYEETVKLTKGLEPLIGTGTGNSQHETKLQSHEFSKDTTENNALFNPLQLFKLIRRLALTLPHLEKELHQDYERSEESFFVKVQLMHNGKFDTLSTPATTERVPLRFLNLPHIVKTLENTRKGVSLPEQSDLDVAIEGLIRVQDAYNLEVADFSTGEFDGLSTNTSLNAADCFLIGSYSLTANVYTRAVEWLERSLYLIQEEFDASISYQTVRTRLNDAISRHNSAMQLSDQRNPYLFREQLHFIPPSRGMEANKRRNKILDTTPHQLYTTVPSFTDLTNFAALCRGEQLQGNDVQKTLNCWLESGCAYTRISPLRVEMLHKEPLVLQIYDVMSPNLSREIISVAQKSSLKRSKVHGIRTESPQGTVSAARTSSSTWLLDETVLKKVERIYPPLEQLLGLSLRTRGACEEFQVASYSATAHYNPHSDNIFLPSQVGQVMNKEEVEKGDRVATIMFYLSDVPRGGLTAFPRLGLAVKPIKGSAVFWFNFKRNGYPEELSLHGGCPILFGNKWIGNQWIRSNSQMFTRKCQN